METEKELFLKNFNLENYGFESPQLFEDAPLGFSMKKQLSDIDSTTLLSIYISDRIYNNKSLGKKKVISQYIMVMCTHILHFFVKLGAYENYA